MKVNDTDTTESPLSSDVELPSDDVQQRSRLSHEALKPKDDPMPESEAEAAAEHKHNVLLASLTIAQLTTVTFMSSFSTGLITVAIPTMARELGIPPQTYYWPLSVYGLTAGSLLLPAGAVADMTGSRRVYLIGVFFLAIFIMGSGIARTAIQLIMFRAMQGIAVALTLPTSVGIISNSIAAGRIRNIGFACTGLGMPLGYSVGSVLGGVFVATTGWRVGWYLCASVTFAFFLLGIFTLPADNLEKPATLKRIRTEIDWVGTLISSASLATLAYALVEISSDPSYIHRPEVLAMLILGIVLIPCFAFWMHREESHNRPALIPNSFWKCMPFTTVCLMVLFSYAVMQTMELYCSLYFQNVQHLTALRASLQLLPSMILGAIINLLAGILVDHVSVVWLVLISSVLCAGGPLLMALINPAWPYWYAAFPAQILQPLSADVLFTVGLITISEVFPNEKQALAGAVFNTVGQFGQSIGLALMGVVSGAVTQGSPYADKTSAAALEVGYKAGFWMAFALMVLTCVLSVVGLRKVGRIGSAEEDEQIGAGG